jgi:hypothetical protein
MCTSFFRICIYIIFSAYSNVGASQRCPLVIPGLTDLDQEGRTRDSQASHGQGFSDKPCTGPAHVNGGE